MTAPVAQTGAGNVTGATSIDTTTVVVSKPANVADGDLLVAAVYVQNTSVTSVTAPSGWTLLAALSSRPGGIYAKAIPSAAAESASTYTWTFNTTSARNSAQIVRLTGAKLSSLPDAAGTTATTSGTTSCVIPAVSPVSAATLMFTMVYTNLTGGVVATLTPPGGTTELDERGSTSANNSTSSTSINAQTLSASGSTGTRTYTISTTATNSGGIAVTLAGLVTVALGRATDTEVARAVVRRKARTLGRAVDTEVARSVSRRKTKSLGRATDTEVARAVTRRKVRVIGRAVDTEVARGVTSRKVRQVASTAEVDLARSVSVRKVATLGRPAETDVARAVSASLAAAPDAILGRATENDWAYPLTTWVLTSHGWASSGARVPTARLTASVRSRAVSVAERAPSSSVRAARRGS